MLHAWKGQAHACIMHGRENHARSMHGMVDLCMYHAWIMHDTCIHAWNTLKHACFMYRISSRADTSQIPNWAYSRFLVSNIM